ncbi:hypothetical protein ACFX1Z_028374 [Malus domestica]
MRSKVLWKRRYDQTFTGDCSISCYSNFPVFLCGFPNSLSSSIILRDEYDLVKYIKMVQQASLFVNLQIGPYVCAEWNFGGFPVWLKYVSGIVFRRTMSLSRLRIVVEEFIVVSLEENVRLAI